MSETTKRLFDSFCASAAETEALGANLAGILAEEGVGAFVALGGELGAGKTAFTRGMASVIAPDAAVTSPTYAIVNIYTGKALRICHFDLYRLADEDDLESTGFYDFDDGKSIIVTEWYEKIPSVLPDRYYLVRIGYEGEGRHITVDSVAEQR